MLFSSSAPPQPEPPAMDIPILLVCWPPVKFLSGRRERSPPLSRYPPVLCVGPFFPIDDVRETKPLFEREQHVLQTFTKTPPRAVDG